MQETEYRGRRAATIENRQIRVTVLRGGGHIAEILDKETGVNPLWTPPWPSIEPSNYTPGRFPEYGAGPEAKLLAGIMGHNLCLDLFGGPSPEEAVAGITVHGEGSVLPYEIEGTDAELRMHTELPSAGLAFERHLELRSRAVRVRETVENLGACDRPIAWTQHVTLGPPFLQKGVTQFRASATRSKVFETDFGSAPYLAAGAEFAWPLAPGRSSGQVDLRVFNDAPASSAYTTHLMDTQREWSFFAAWSPTARLALGYLWRTSDFPWLGIWEENRSREHAPWKGVSIARGMEFGASPFPESRREMIERGHLFGAPCYRWLPARGRLQVEYWAALERADTAPETLEF